jgi:hypothetical protein
MLQGTLMSLSGNLPPYTAVVANHVNAVSITPIASEAAGQTETIKVNGSTVASGQASPEISLQTGVNLITVQAISQNGVVQKTYTIAVIRRPAGKLNILETLLEINNRYDVNGDGVFDAADISAILSGIEPRFVN